MASQLDGSMKILESFRDCIQSEIEARNVLIEKLQSELQNQTALLADRQESCNQSLSLIAAAEQSKLSMQAAYARLMENAPPPADPRKKRRTQE
jgi:hypothetical protein